jgi:hypothetical protein
VYEKEKETENAGEDESLEWNEDLGEIRTSYPIEVVVVNNDDLVKTMLEKSLKSKRKTAILKKMKNTDILIKSN